MAASEDIQTDLDRDPDWWANWFEQDFSWEGLKEKPWQGWVVVDERCCMPEGDAPEDVTIREATLQDYWRADPEADWALRDLGEPGEADSQAELVQLGDTVWHRAHVPPATLEGVRSWKADPKDKRFEAHWAQVQADLQARLARGFEPKVNGEIELEGPDGRTQLDGAVINGLSLPHENEGSPVHLSMAYTAHLLGVDARNTHFGGHDDFERASFGGEARFDSASFGGDARFHSASFGGDARFHSASFGGDAWFDSASFDGDAWFDSASFGGDTHFDSARFGRVADFDSARFGGVADFDSASFGRVAWFVSASFGGDTWFDSARFGEDAGFHSASFGGKALFDSARFGGDARFDSARFGGDARFHSVSFGGDAWFHSASFGGKALFDSASFGWHAIFDSASFGGDVSFHSVSFGSNASFHSASFGCDALFDNSSFGGDAGFESARFSGRARFESASFAGGNAKFENVSFGGIAGFESASFGGEAGFESTRFDGHAYFESASFSDNAWFIGARFGGFAWFNNASFDGDAWFIGACFGGTTKFHSAVFLQSAFFQRGSPPAQVAGRLVSGTSGEAAIKAVSQAAEESDYTLVLTHGAAKRETGAFKTFHFSKVLCLGDVDFSDRGFGAAPDFQNSRFYGRADFHKADMHEGVKLTGAQFRLDDGLGVLSWRALVAYLALFYAPFGPYRYGPVQLGEKRHLSFWKAAHQSWNAYHDHTCKQERPVRGLIKTAFGFPTQLYSAQRKPNQHTKPHSSHRHLDAPAEYEASYRRLKRIMGGIGSHIEEQRFFALELIARQQRTDVNIWERRVAADYGLIADYGRSFVRPLMALAVVCIVMSGLYAGLAGLGGALAPPASISSAPAPITAVQRHDAPPYTRPSVWTRTAEERRWVQGQVLRHQARKLAVLRQVSGPLVFAAEITLAPVANPIRYHPWALRLNEKGGAWSAAFSALRLIHRMLAIPLIFLFALSLRRRFQLG